MVILIDNGHGSDTKGKCSPDALKGLTSSEYYFREYKYAREIAKAVVTELQGYGFGAKLLVPEENDIPLSERVRRINEVVAKVGRENVICVSIHVNAAGSDGNWHSATGWSVYTSKGQDESDRLADCLWYSASHNCKGQKMREDRTDGDRDNEENFTMVYSPKCCAKVLTENFFQDCQQDVLYLLSKRGRSEIVATHVDGIIAYLQQR